jgi:hypothetical protein
MSDQPMDGQRSMDVQRRAATPAITRTTERRTWCAPGSARHGVPLRLALLGGSFAIGPSTADPRDTAAGRLALGLSAAGDQPVCVDTAATAGALSRDLGRQVDAVAASGCPEVAVVIAGADDVLHHRCADDAVRRLALAVHGLTVLGARVVVGTCPDVSLAGAIAEPLPHLARRRARALGRAQAAAVRAAGGIAVDLFGRADAAHALLPVVCAALGLSSTRPPQPHAA